MTAAGHPLEREEVMAYVDGELDPAEATAVASHLSQCAGCQTIADDLRLVASEMARWRVEEAPESLRVPKQTGTPGGSRFWRRTFWRQSLVSVRIAGVGVAVLAILVLSLRSILRPALKLESAGVAPIQGQVMPQPLDRAGQLSTAPPPAAVMAGSGGAFRQQGQGGAIGQQGQGTRAPGATEPAPAAASRAPMVTRTATLRLVTRDFDAARSEVDRILTENGGFVGSIDISAARAEARSFNASVRIPATRLDAALAAFKRLGQVVSESQGTDDVTEQAVDLDARLANARNTERRLTQVLQQRTGDVADVLAVEREIARVRGEIERAEAERTNLRGRVEYAVVRLEIAEQRKAAIDLGPTPVSAQIANALVDGGKLAFESVLHVLLLGSRVGPALLLWAIVAGWPALALIRRRRVRNSPE